MSLIVTTQIQPHPFSQQRPENSTSRDNKEAVTTRNDSLFLKNQQPSETHLLDLNNGICLNRVFSQLTCRESLTLSSTCKVLSSIHKSSPYLGWARAMYAAKENLDRIGIQVPSSLEEALEYSELFFESVKNRLEEINEILPPGIKHVGSIKSLLSSKDQTLDFLKTLYQYSLVQAFGELAGVTDAMTLQQKAELVVTWLNTPERIATVTSLERPGSNLFCIPREIEKLTNLTVLGLQKNQLSSIPPEIGKLTNLTTLWLDENQLSFLPPEIGTLMNLTVLWLNENQLSSIPPEIGKLTKLTEFWMRKNKLTSLPKEIGTLTNLPRLDLRENLLTSLKEICNLPKLREIWLDHATAVASSTEIETMKRQKVKINENFLKQ